MQDVLKCIEDTDQMVENQPQQVDPVTSSFASSSNSSHIAIDPKYVQLLGDKAAVSVNNCKYSYILSCYCFLMMAK